MSKIQLFQGDCLELMKDIPDKSIDLILADLPYGISRCEWDAVIPFDPLWEQYKRVIKRNRAIIIFGSEPFSSRLRLSNIKNYKYDWVWDKHSTTGFLNAKKRPLRRFEQICVFCYGKPPYFPQMEIRGRIREKRSYNKKTGNGDMVYNSFKSKSCKNNEYYPTDILSFSNAFQKGKIHPTQKPVPLLEYLIKTYVNEDETVFDSCMGSGSTGVAAVHTNRDFIGMELDDKYFQIAKERIEKAGESNAEP